MICFLFGHKARYVGKSVPRAEAVESLADVLWIDSDTLYKENK